VGRTSYQATARSPVARYGRSGHPPDLDAPSVPPMERTPALGPERDVAPAVPARMTSSSGDSSSRTPRCNDRDTTAVRAHGARSPWRRRHRCPRRHRRWHGWRRSPTNPESDTRSNTLRSATAKDAPASTARSRAQAKAQYGRTGSLTFAPLATAKRRRPCHRPLFQPRQAGV
jgi:hypothetical protein